MGDRAERKSARASGLREGSCFTLFTTKESLFQFRLDEKGRQNSKRNAPYTHTNEGLFLMYIIMSSKAIKVIVIAFRARRDAWKTDARGAMHETTVNGYSGQWPLPNGEENMATGVHGGQRIR